MRNRPSRSRCSWRPGPRGADGRPPYPRQGPTTKAGQYFAAAIEAENRQRACCSEAGRGASAWNAAAPGGNPSAAPPRWRTGAGARPSHGRAMARRAHGLRRRAAHAAAVAGPSPTFRRPPGGALPMAAPAAVPMATPTSYYGAVASAAPAAAAAARPPAAQPAPRAPRPAWNRQWCLPSAPLHPLHPLHRCTAAPAAPPAPLPCLNYVASAAAHRRRSTCPSPPPAT